MTTYRTSPTSRRVLLRAELEHQGKTTVSHTLLLSERTAVIQSDVPLPLDEAVHLRLSFPRFVDPLDFDTTVAAHWVSNKPGVPSTITLRIDSRSAAQARELDQLLARLDTIEPDAAPARFRVLLVEDSSLIRDVFAYGVRKFFNGQRSQVTLDLAVDGDEAWERLCGESYDLAIVDLFLPLAHGSHLLSRMRKDPRLAGLPVVGISGGGAAAREAMLEAGADLFLDKPLVMRDLFATFERLAQRGAGR
jgi:CheY-like chemotaxis protein